MTRSHGCSRSAATGTRSSRSITPKGASIFESFARGVNAAIQQALDENKIPVEFQIMGFRPAAGVDGSDDPDAHAWLDALSQCGE